jgi:hypothetical protein
MSEGLQLQDPIFKLVVRFSNGETISHFVSELIDPTLITSDTRYAVITSISCQDPSQCAEITVVNLRDVTYIKTERVSLERLTAERRPAGILNAGSPNPEEKLPKTIAQVKFV